MRSFTKIVFGAALLSTAIAGAAQAGVSLSVDVGNRPRPVGWYGPPGHCAVYRYHYGAPWRNCGYPYWYEPIYVDGHWYHGPFYYHTRYGQRWYWWHGSWRRDEWRGGPNGWRGSARWGH